MFNHLTQVARECLSHSKYKLYSEIESAPAKVDCSSFTQWLFMQVGVQIPRLAREQYSACSTYHPARSAIPGDLVFRKCHFPRFKEGQCPLFDFGHVGFTTLDLTVIHASWAHGEVVEEPLSDYFEFKNRGLWIGRLSLGEMI